MHSLLTLGFLSLAAAIPATDKNLSSSKGIKLRIKLQDPLKDLEKPVKNTYLTSIHDGAGLNQVGQSDTGRIFYINGTGSDGLFWSTISDGGTPAYPYGLALHPSKDSQDVQNVRLDVGKADTNIYVPAKDTHPQLYPTNWLACDEPLEYYGGQHFTILRRNAFQNPPPKQCVLITLLPECTKLNDLPNGSASTHEFAIKVNCYKDASKV